MVDRRWAARIAAPAALLAAITIGVLLVRAGLHDEPDETEVVATVPPQTGETEPEAPATQPPAQTQPETQPEPEPVYATVEAGDTLAGIASEHDTTVERLLELNPGLDPTALQIGQRVRVR